MKEPKQIKSDYSNETRLALLEQSLGAINNSLLEIRHDLKYGFEKIDNKFDKIDAKFEKINSRMDNMFYWILGIAGTLGIGVFFKLFMK